VHASPVLMASSVALYSSCACRRRGVSLPLLLVDVLLVLSPSFDCCFSEVTNFCIEWNTNLRGLTIPLVSS